MTALPPNVEASRTASTVFLGGATKLSSGGIEIEDERAQRSHDIIKTQARFFNVVNLTVGKLTPGVGSLLQRGYRDGHRAAGGKLCQAPVVSETPS